jgi:glycosyltransferase involved in cell wall biosynthesis
VRFTGELPVGDLQRWVAHAQALVLPSYYEGFGLPPLEAMALGTPVVVSDRASLPEVCGDAALYVNPDQPATIAAAMGRIAADPHLRASLSIQGKKRASEFSWDKTLKGTLKVMDEVLRD